MTTTCGLPGNVPDVVSIENALKQLKCLSLVKPLIVTDNGYYSRSNMMEFAMRNVKFLVQKGGLDGSRPRTWYPDTLRGRQFAQFVSLGYHCFLFKKLKEMRATLGKDETGKTKDLVKLEKSLDKWIAQRSLVQILDWFDCVQTTTVQTAMGNYRWSTESIARDKLFLERLGVKSE